MHQKQLKNVKSMGVIEAVTQMYYKYSQDVKKRAIKKWEA